MSQNKLVKAVKDLESQLKNLTVQSWVNASIEADSVAELKEAADELNKCHVYKPFEIGGLNDYYSFDYKPNDNIRITVKSVQRYKEVPNIVEL